MDPKDFHDGLKSDRDKDEEWSAAAEHFVRLKRRSGLGEDSDPDLEKDAGSIHDFIQGAKAGVKYHVGGPKMMAKGLSVPGHKARSAGFLGATAAPLGIAAAVGRLSKRDKEKKANFEDEHGITDIADRLKSRHKLKKQASIMSRVKDVDPVLAAVTGAGALAGTIGTYLSSRPKKELGGRSSSERDLAAVVKGQKGEPETGFLEKLKNRTTESSHGYAKAMREHPGKAALFGGVVGGLGAHSIARLLGAGGKGR